MKNYEYIRMSIIVIFLFILSSCCNDEPKVNYNPFGDLWGNIVDEDTYKPITNVNITLTPTGKNTLSDYEGVFIFENLDSGNYTIQAQKAGYITNRKNVNIFASEVTTVVIQMKKSEY